MGTNMNRFLSFVVLAGLTSITSVWGQNATWTLEQCVDHALANNITVQQTELDEALAKVNKLDAIGNFLPSINAQANHSWNIGLNQNITTGLLENQTTQFTSAGLNANIDVFKGFQNHLIYRRAKLSSLAARYQLDKIKDDVALNVANAYLQILFAKETVVVLEEQMALNQLQLSRTQAMVDAGSLALADLKDMQATVASTKKSLVDAQNNLRLTKLSLSQLLQIREFQTFDIADQDMLPENSAVLLESVDAIIEKAKSVRQELQIAQANKELAEFDLKIARSSYSPTLQGYYSFSTRAAYADRVTGMALSTSQPSSVIGSVEGTGQNVITPNYVPILGRRAAIFDQFDDNKGHNFGFQLTIPILNRLNTRNNVVRNKIALERATLAYNQTEQDLERSVFQAITDAQGAMEAYESAKVAADARSLAFDYAREKYEVGMINSFDFAQAQNLHLTAQSDLVRAKYDYIFRTKVLEYYFGIPLSK